VTNAGVLAVGLYAPPDVRRNDWWPPEVIARWAQQRQGPPTIPSDLLTDGARRVLAAVANQATDPFGGVVERRVLAPEMTLLDAEVHAARDALVRSRIDPHDIDLLLTHAVVADHQLANPACSLHERLGLAPNCLAAHVEATGYSALAQLGLADAAIVSGRARYALLVQSCAATRLVEQTDPSSVLVGDAATAFVVGPVGAGRGVLGTAHFTEGRYPNSLIMSVPGARWFDDGDVRVHVADPGQLIAAHLRTPDSCAEAVMKALERSGHVLADVDVLCVGQGTAWLQPVVYEQLGVSHIRPFEMFQRFGYLSSASIPAALRMAEQAGELADDDLVVTVGGGTGATYGAVVMRWGNG
jgi:3-oxoacyl-[acyl-carrier-protein] synthase III